MDTGNPPDEQLQSLLDRCAAADAPALERLYELASPVLFAALIRILRRRSLAEEALQDVFVSIWQRAGQFQSSRGRTVMPMRRRLVTTRMASSTRTTSRAALRETPYRASMVARIDVVSVGSELTRGPRSSGEITSAGIRVPGPMLSDGPGVSPPWPGGETWSHCPPNSS